MSEENKKEPIVQKRIDSRLQIVKHTRLLLAIGFVIIFGLGVLFGATFGVTHVLAPGVTDAFSQKNSPVENVNLSQFWQIWNEIKYKYVDNKTVKNSDLLYGAMQGMMASLNDPYSIYFPPKQAKAFESDLSGKFDGIGAEIGMNTNNQLNVIAPLSGSPAQKAGLHARDLIVSVNSSSTASMSVEQAARLIRGKKGTTVVLGILRSGWTIPKSFTIIRDTITVPSVTSKMQTADIAYIHISFFNNNTGIDFQKAIDKLLPKHPKGIILDMRNNPGGYLDTSVDVASEWVTTGIVVSEHFGNGKIQTYKTHGLHPLNGIPTVVLVDGGTASGAEIVSGALQDYKKAIIMGQQTYGKGSVQEFETLPDGSAFKLTIAKWYTPNNREINHTGITPDVIVDPMFVTSTVFGAEPIDVGLQKAEKMLQSKIK